MQFDVIVVGAGIQGLSTALNLALRDRNVIVIEKDTPGRHASGVNAGGVRSLWRHTAEIPLALASLELWRDMERLVGADCDYHSNGSLRIAETEADMAVLQDRVAELADLGFTHEELLGQNALRSLVPDVASHCVGGLVSRNEGSANPYQTVMAFHKRTDAQGVTVLTGHAVTALERTGGGWRVTAGEETVEGNVLVNCSGAWGNALAEKIGDDLPLSMEAPTMMVTERVQPFLGPVCGLASRKLSFKQTSTGTLLIGGGHPGIVDRAREQARPDIAKLALSARTVVDVFPLMKGVRMARSWCGLEGVTPDHLPILGPSPNASDAFHAFGFSAHGFALGPIVGRILADLITVGHCDLPIAPFSPTRFIGSGQEN